MNRIAKIAAFVIVVATAAGCTTRPIMNVDNVAVAPASGKTLTAQDVRGAIIRAGTGLGWQIKDESPTTLVGTLNLRAHTAVVEIPYSAKSFSIKYRSSVNLKEEGGQIHKNYNGWIQNLTRAINAQIAAL